MRERNNISFDAVVIPRSLFQDKSFNQGRVNDLFAFIDLIQMATLEEKIETNKRIPVKLERGEIATSLRLLADRWGCSVKAASNILSKHEREHRVTRIKSNLTSIISIVNFDQFILNGNAEGNAEGDTSRAQNELYNYNLNNNIINSDSKSDKSKEGTSKANSENREKEKNTLLSHASHDDVSESFSAAADRVYAAYPASVKRADGSRRTLRCTSDKKKIIRLLKNGHTEEELVGTINTYLSENPGEYTRMLSTFLNNLPDYSTPEPPVKRAKPLWVELNRTYSLGELKKRPGICEQLPEDLYKHLKEGKWLKWGDGNWVKC